MAVNLYQMIGASPLASVDELVKLIADAEALGQIDQSFAHACRDVLLNADRRTAYDKRLQGEALVGAVEVLAPELIVEAADPTPVARPTKFCHACGEVIDKEAVICPKCGVKQSKEQPASHRLKSKAVAALLAFFLGFVGFHRFYLGNNPLGFVYLLFFWTGIPWIVSWFEALYFITMKDASFDRIYNCIDD